jgi:hypothetical protein
MEERAMRVMILSSMSMTRFMKCIEHKWQMKLSAMAGV